MILFFLRKCRLKSQMKCHYTPILMAKIKYYHPRAMCCVTNWSSHTLKMGILAYTTILEKGLLWCSERRICLQCRRQWFNPDREDPLKKGMTNYPVCQLGKSHGQSALAVPDYLKESDRTEHTHSEKQLVHFLRS